MTPNRPSLSERERAILRMRARAWARRPRLLRRLGPTPRVPSGPEQAYALALRASARETSAAIAKAVLPLLSVWLEEAKARQDADTPSVQSTIQRLRAELRASGAPGRRMAEAVSAANTAAMNAHVSPLTGGIPIWRGVSPGSREILNTALTENVRLIKSIPSELLGDVETVLRDSLSTGSRVEVIQRRLQERFDIGERRAELIARDQVGKLNAQLVEERSSEQGFDGYTWVATGNGTEERVRPRHRELHGQQILWAEPPIVDEKTGRRCHAGEDVQCRCTADLDVSGYLDSIGA